MGRAVCIPPLDMTPEQLAKALLRPEPPSSGSSGPRVRTPSPDLLACVPLVPIPPSAVGTPAHREDVSSAW